MNKIVISSLHLNPTKTLLYELTIEQTKTILGGVYPSGIGIMNITDSTYLFNSPRKDRRYWSIGPYSHTSNENSYNTVDNSRSIYNGLI